MYADNYYRKFLYDFRVNGKRKRGIIDYSSLQHDKRTRVRNATVELSRMKDDAEDNIERDIVFGKFMERFFDIMPPTRWTRTKRGFYDKYIEPKLGRKKVADIRQMHIKELVVSLEKKGLSKRTVKQVIEVLSPAFDELVANRVIDFNPCMGVKVKREKTKKIVAHATDELKRITKAIYDTFGDDPFYLSLYLFALQGRRKSEILNLKWKDVDADNGYYILRDTKSGKTQKLYLPDVIKEQLLKFWGAGGEYVFTSRITGKQLSNIEKQTKKLKEVLGGDFSLHYLRNVIVSAMAEQGLDAIYLSGALGHSSPTTILKYLTMNYMIGSQKASEVIDGLQKHRT